jgi:hypothetical protein
MPDSFDRSDVLQTNMIENVRVPQTPGFDTICNTRVMLAGVLQRIWITVGGISLYLIFRFNEKNKNVGSK